MPSLTQNNRKLAIETALGSDVVLLRGFTFQERLGRPFSIEAELFSEAADIKFDDIVGTNATIRLEIPEGDTRYFNGIVSRFSQGANKGGLAHYRATIVPWLWLLTRTSDCRIFQQKSVPDILKQVFQDHGFSDFEDKLTESYQTKEYCVQYRETYFNFVCRLMEQEGIYYYFTHENGKHTMVLADSASAHSPLTGFETIEFSGLGDSVEGRQVVTDWQVEMQVQPGAYVLNDFNFETPRNNLAAATSVTRPNAASNYELYDYPGEYTEHAEGERLAKVRLAEYQTQYRVCRGQATVRAVTAGATFKLDKFPRTDQNAEYLITSISLQADGGDFGAGETEGGDFYSCSFEVIEKAETFRAPQVTPKPLIQGLQTAIVTGKKGEEIEVDEHGRVKVQFHWDRYSKADENSSCWIRVAQLWAGKKWGSIYTPRIGQEVVVEFLEGDPDRPLITGRVYNGEAKPPYDLPAEKTKSTLKSNSSKGGDGFNEIRFEDKKDNEQLFIHAQKDMDLRVKNDRKVFVGGGADGSKKEGSLHLIVKKDQFEKVEGDKHQTVKGDQFGKNEGDIHETIKGGQFVKIEGDDNLEIKGNQAVKTGADVHLKAGGNLNTEAGQKISLKSGMDLHAKAGMNYAMDAGMAIHLKAGMTVVIEGGVQLSLKVGGNFIDINPGGVFITGTTVMINSGGAAGSGGGSSPTAPTAPEAPDPPKEPKEADQDKAGEVDKAPKAPKPPKPVSYSSQAKVMKQAAADGTPFCEECEKAKQQQAAGAS